MNHLCKQICLTALLMAISLPSLFGEDFFRIKEEITAEAWLKKSIFYISPTLNINNIGYNSNVYSYEYLDTPDWNADAGLTLDLAVLLKDRFIFQVTETPSYSFYDENESERAFNNEFRFNAYTWLGKFNLEYQFEKLYLRQRSSLESGWRIRRWETSHRVSLDYGRRNRFYFNLYVQKRDLTYGDELLLDTFNMNRMFNRTEYLLGISANKNIFSRSTLAFQFEYFDDRFLYTKLRNRTGGQVSMRLTIPAGSHLTGQMRIGLRFTRPQSSLYRDFTKPFGSGTLTLSLMGRFRLQVNYRLDSTYSFAAADLYYDVRTIGSGLSFFITREISISYNYTTGYRTYKLIGVNDESRRDQFSTSRIRLRIRRGEKTELGFEYGINRTDSTSLRFNRSQDYIGGYFRYDL